MISVQSTINRSHPECSGRILGNARNRIRRKATGISRGVPVLPDLMAVIPVQPFLGNKPEISLAVLECLLNPELAELNVSRCDSVLPRLGGHAHTCSGEKQQQRQRNNTPQGVLVFNWIQYSPDISQAG